jgi:hypothetical protein
MERAIEVHPKGSPKQFCVSSLLGEVTDCDYQFSIFFAGRKIVL